MTSAFFKIFSPIIFLFFPAHAIVTESPTISIFPPSVIQGEPLEIVIQNATSSQVKNISFNGKNLGVFAYQNKSTAFVGVDINQKPLTYVVSATLSDDTTLTKYVMVGARQKIETAFSIPASLGGNSTSSAVSLVNTLAEENAELLKLVINPKNLWTNKFIYPLSQITVTDGYGYSRQTSGVSITHKGTDFRASTGTSVMTMNRGIVRLAKKFTEYGNTIVIDHGLGLMTFYMHLSKINVNVGELVNQGQIIGLSGDTGDALAPHLHVSVRINNISIDPIKFMALFK